MAEKIKVILDTDIGSDIDDAVALAYLLSQPRCELLGITTVTGEAGLRAQMASAMCRHVGREDVPIHAGTQQAILGDILQKKAPQAGALGERARRRDFAANTAVEFLRRTIRAHPGEVTLLGIGPLTNVALLFAMDPEIPALLGGLVLMCGQFFDCMKGEWNAKNDPLATAVVYNGAQKKPGRHISFGLDVTMKCQMAAEEVRRKFSAKVLEPVRDFAEVWFRDNSVLTFHDPLAAACIFEPGLCGYKRGEVTVSTTAPTAGWTVFAEKADGPHTVAATVKVEEFFGHYFAVVR